MKLPEILQEFFHSNAGKVVLVILIAFASHLIVLLIKKIREPLFRSLSKISAAKIKTLWSLISSVLVFLVYFIALGIILKQLGISVTAYVATASVIGLAVGFGTQGIVQDVVNGITLIVTDLIDVGDMVEINGQTGPVKSVGMRFTVISSALGTEVYIPNRIINNVFKYPLGFLACIVDINLPDSENEKQEINELVKELIDLYQEKYSNFFIGRTVVKTKAATKTNKDYIRIIFRLWPARGNLIEGNFKSELIFKLKQINSDYQDWMVNIYFDNSTRELVSLKRKKK